jgi:hypothetical protein
VGAVTAAGKRGTKVVEPGKMRWEEAFPGAPIGAEQLPGLARQHGSGPCGACGSVTEWRDSQLRAWVCCADCGEQLAMQERSRTPRSRRGWIRTIGRIVMLFVMWVPIIGSGIANLREGLGYGVARPWDSAWAWLGGIAFWLLGSVIWIGIVKWVTRLLGLADDAHSDS